MIKFMPQRDPLEELFRQNEGQLDQRPNLRTWRRLEQRLDARNGRSQRRTQGPFKPWMYAAAVLLLCVTAFGLGQNALNRSNTLAQRPEIIEELPTEKVSLPTISTYRSIAEGDKSQVLRVKNNPLPELLPAPKYRL